MANLSILQSAPARRQEVAQFVNNDENIEKKDNFEEGAEGKREKPRSPKRKPWGTRNK